MNEDSTHTPVELGPYDLIRPIGRGGMGEVWEAIHRQQEVHVAVKVLTRDYARESLFLTAFREEVQLVPRLDHPGVVLVFDHGRVPESAAAATDGLFVEGSPFLVMELLSGGTLKDRDPIDAWPTLRSTLLAVLDALGHAHARGVLHRDIKPGNVIVGASGDLRPGLKLIDFGLATLGAHYGTGEAAIDAGTPNYMAPEQIRTRESRDHGPYTDLYQLGCLAYGIASGTPPFDAETADETFQSHLFDPLPSLETRFPVPPEFEGWLARMLEKEPRDRFRRAADAAASLRQLPEAVDESQTGAAGTEAAGPKTAPAARNRTTILTPRGSAGPLRPAPPVRPRGPVVASQTRSDMPETWRRPARTEQRAIRLVGAGLSLYGLRPIPVVAREKERDRLWEALREVHSGQGARAVVLEGPTGVGKSRLAEWICERAHEEGAAQVLRAVYSDNGGPTDGFARAVARHLGCIGLPRSQVLRRIWSFYDERAITDSYEWHAMTELVSPLSPERVARTTAAVASVGSQGAVSAPVPEQRRGNLDRVIRFAGPHERYALLGRFLGLVSQERPVILWIDDVQWGSDALQFVQWWMNQGAALETRALIVLTARSEALDERPAEQRLLDEVTELPSAMRLRIGPLSAIYQSTLVEELLGLESDVAQMVVERSGGNPLFAVQLVGDWVERGVLEVATHGFRLRKGEKAEIPDDLHALWRMRVARVVDEVAEQESTIFRDAEALRRSLELAALLGRQVVRREWRLASRRAGLPVAEDLAETMIEERLAMRTEDGWAFAHGLLRESLIREARDRGDGPRLHQACADMLQTRRSARKTGVALRVARHLIEAGNIDGAYAPMLEAAQEQLHLGEFQATFQTLQAREMALDRHGVEADDPRRIEGWVLRATALITEGRDVSRASRWIDRAEAAATRLKSDPLRSAALDTRGLLLATQGRLPDAAACHREALTLLGHARRSSGYARTLRNLADVEGRMGNFGEATQHWAQAKRLFQDLGDPFGQAMCLSGMSDLLRTTGDLEGARRVARQALDVFEQLGFRTWQAATINAIAESDRRAGNLDAAARGYRESIALFRSIGAESEIHPRMNLGLVLIRRGQYAAARLHFEDLAEMAARSGRESLVGGIHAALLVIAAGEGNWNAWHDHLRAAKHFVETSGAVEFDDAQLWEEAGNLAMRRGRRALAVEPLQVAVELWRKLGENERAFRTSEALASCRR